MQAVAMMMLYGGTAQDTPTTETSVSGVQSSMSDNLPGWANQPGSYFTNFPDRYWEDFSSWVPDQPTMPAGATVQYHCPNPHPSVTACDFVVFFYDCPSCPSKKGGLEALLNDDTLGYTKTRCAPTFVAVADGNQHKMTGYVKVLQPGETVSIELTDDLDFALFGMSNGGALANTCAEQSVSIWCTHSSLSDFCEWTASSTCTLNKCDATGECDPNVPCVYAEVGTAVPTPAPVQPEMDTSFPSLLTFFNDIMPGWGSRSGSYMTEFPVRYTNDFLAVVPSEHVLEGTNTVSLHCPYYPTATSCDAVAFVYECESCGTAQGGLDVSLPNAGYTRTLCAPKFVDGASGDLQTMVGYTKELLPGQTEEITLEGTAKYVLFGLSNGGRVDCSISLTEGQCGSYLNYEFCEWTGQECIIAQCADAACASSASCPVDV